MQDKITGQRLITLPFFEKMEVLKYLETNLRNQNYIQEETKSRMKSGSAPIIRCRIFYLLGCYLKIQILRYTELYFACCFVWV